MRFLGWVDDDTLIRLYAECFAVFYAPVDEDYGLATVEAFQAGKPVVTASDSGGVLEFVEDGVSGCVSAPNPALMAAANSPPLRGTRRSALGWAKRGARRWPASSGKQPSAGFWNHSSSACMGAETSRHV